MEWDKSYNKDLKEICKKYGSIPTIINNFNNIIAIGDIHGDLELALQFLEIGKMIKKTKRLNNEHNKFRVPYFKDEYQFLNYYDKLDDIILFKFNEFDDDLKFEYYEWIGKDTYVIQVGDQIDRYRPLHGDYEHVIENDENSDILIMRLYYVLNNIAKKNNCQIFNLIGNHEILNIDNDFRYVSKKGNFNISEKEYNEKYKNKKNFYNDIFNKINNPNNKILHYYNILYDLIEKQSDEIKKIFYNNYNQLRADIINDNIIYNNKAIEDINKIIIDNYDTEINKIKQILYKYKLLTQILIQETNCQFINKYNILLVLILQQPSSYNHLKLNFCFHFIHLFLIMKNNSLKKKQLIKNKLQILHKNVIQFKNHLLKINYNEFVHLLNNNVNHNRYITRINMINGMRHELGCTRSTIIIIGGCLFVHGGVSSDLLKEFDVFKINEIIRMYIMSHFIDRKILIENNINDDVLSKVAHGDNYIKSPLWDRDLTHDEFQDISFKQIKEILKKQSNIDLKNIIVGHTPQNDGIGFSNNKQIIKIDIGGSKAFDQFFHSKKRKTQVLKIQNNNNIYKYEILSSN